MWKLFDEGTTALVTGGSRGIGRAIALELARENVDVIINYKGNDAKAFEVRDEIISLGRKCIAIKADMKNSVDGRRKMLKRICRIMVIALLVVAMNSNSLYAEADSNNEIICPVYETGDESEYLSMPQFELKILKRNKRVTMPINVPSEGIMNMILFDVVDERQESYDDMKIDINIYKDSKREKLIASKSCSNFLGIYYETFTFDNSGIYYLETIVSRNKGNDIDRDINLCLMPSLIMTGNRNMKNNIWVYGASIRSKASYYKIKINSTGYFAVNIDVSEPFDANKLNISLCDNKKKEITDNHELSKDNNNLVFAVDEGTYYLKITQPMTNIKREFKDYRIKYIFTKQKDNSGINLKSASPIKINGSEMHGLQTLQDKNSDWYKVTLNKSTDLKIEIDKQMLQGDLKLELFDSKSKKIDMNLETLIIGNNKSTVYSMHSKLKKGTYYIKLSKAEKKASGYYHIKTYENKKNN